VDEVGAALLELRVGAPLLGRAAVEGGLAEHAHVEVGVLEPVDGLLGRLHGAEHHLRVQVVDELGDELALDGQLLVEHGQVVLELGVAGDEDAHARLVVLRAAGAAQHLEDVEGAELDPAALVRRVHLGALKKQSNCWRFL